MWAVKLSARSRSGKMAQSAYRPIWFRNVGRVVREGQAADFLADSALMDAYLGG